MVEGLALHCKIYIRGSLLCVLHNGIMQESMSVTELVPVAISLHLDTFDNQTLPHPPTAT